MTFSSIKSPKTGMHISRATWPLTFMSTQSGTVFISTMWRLYLWTICAACNGIDLPLPYIATHYKTVINVDIVLIKSVLKTFFLE